MSLRTLTGEETRLLEQQGCWAADWQQLFVAEEFTPARVRNSRFYGTVELGRFEAELETEPGVHRPSGIYESTLQDCCIADDVRIAGVGELVRYSVESGAVLQQVGSLVATGDSSFGNGVTLDILNEGGGRRLPIFDRLSAQLAYILVHYRHDAQVIACIETMIDAYSAARRAPQGRIGRGARILRCGALCNIVVGPRAEIYGATELCNGTLASVPNDPVRIGSGVIARDFIIQSGSHVQDGVLLSCCFIGQGVRLGKQFSAEHSAFFANCDGFHGEVLSTLAGPYTVTHHKSTLLIAAQFSFFNAGSNSNQSNHMYKLGPLHQGLFERGGKSGSGSYLMWPCRIGAFTAVMGKHTVNFDTSDLPFSYIDVQEGKSYITPAMNLFTVGTRRDSAKWPARDRRKDDDKRDRIHFTLFNPYIIGRMLRAIALLDQLVNDTPRDQESVRVNGVHIKRLLLKTCRKYYEIAVQVAIGQALADKLEKSQERSWAAILTELVPDAAVGREEWLDLCGLLAPRSSVEGMLCAIRTNQISDLEELDGRFDALYQEYERNSWSYIAALVEKRSGVSWADMAPHHIQQFIADWREQAIKLNNMILKDAEKEFDANSRIGYGVDGDSEARDADFNAVRGAFLENSFVQQLQQENREIADRADVLLARLQRLSS